jgi:hypothetical protein
MAAKIGIIFKRMAKIGYVLGITLMMVGLILSVLHTPAKAASGAVWTTRETCGNPQNENHYDVGDHIYLNGAGFSPGQSVNWYIKGRPGGASGDPGIVVASGTVNADSNGEFCFKAYTIQPDDWGEYKVTAEGAEGDNYRVGGEPTATSTSTSTATSTATMTPTTTMTPTATATSTSTATSTATMTPTTTSTSTSTATSTATNTPTPTSTGTVTVVPPTATETSVPPTATATNTIVPNPVIDTPTPTPTTEPSSTPEPTTPPSNPEPSATPTETSAPPATLPPPTSPPRKTQPPALIPVTGADFSLAGQNYLTGLYSKILTNLGIGLLGLALAFHGIGNRLNKK